MNVIRAPAILLALALLFVSQAAAEGATRTRAQIQEQMEFASFVDGFIAGVQKERTIPGMVFAAVKDGDVLYLKGYGHADVASGAPADPEKTLFRVGAISQPITAAAVMQLAERGRVGLDDDVNIYLRRWRLPGASDQPVTMRHILTHTAGFDYKELETAAPTAADERAFASRLSRMMPRRVSEPGLFYSESNLGYALLGSIIERLSLTNFDAAVKRNIFQPLGMTESAFFLEGDEMDKLATGYDSTGRPVEYEYRYDSPARSMNTTAYDMGRFMLAQMGGGRIGRSSILGELHAGSMMRRHFSPHPMISGAGLGYLEQPVAGVRTLQKHGSIPGYSSFMMMIPDRNFGVFLAVNASDIDFSEELSVSLVERFFPSQRDRTRAVPQSVAVYPDIEGSYRTNRIPHLTAEKITKLFAEQIIIEINDGGIVATDAHNPSQQTRWFPTSSEDLFRRVGDDGYYHDEYIFFGRDEDGAVEVLVMGGVAGTYERIETFEALNRQRMILSGFAAAALLSFLGLYIGSAVNKGKFPWEKGLTSDTELWGLSSLFWLVQLLFVCGILTAYIWIGHEFKVFVPYQVKALFIVPLGGGLLLTWFWFRLLAKILSPAHHWMEKILIISIAFVATGYMFYLAHWRLLGFMF